MDNNLALATSRKFGNVQCDFWQDKKTNELFMTREQIGTALEYTPDPANAITIIHRRHKERLDKFSEMVNLATSSGTQGCTVYSAKGVFEICRWSRQPKADSFMDWVWDVIDNLRTGEMTLSQNNVTLTSQMIESMIAKHIGVFKKQMEDEVSLIGKEIMADIDRRMVTIANSHLYLVRLAEQSGKKMSFEPAVAKPAPARPQSETRPVLYKKLPGTDPDWKKRMCIKAREIASDNPEQFENAKEVLAAVYAKMRSVYGIVWEQTIKEFKEKYDLDETVRTMSVICDDERLKSIFEGVIFNLMQKKKVPETKFVRVTRKEEPTIQNAIQNAMQKAQTKKQVVQLAVEKDPVKALMNPLIQKRNDRTLHGNRTYQEVYSRMGISWQNRQTRYRNAHGLKCNPRKCDLIRSDKQLLSKLSQVVNAMMSE